MFMSDQAPSGDTPATPAVPETPEGTTPAAPETDWEKRYQDLQPEFTRTTQELAQHRAIITGLQSDDDETRQQALAALGLEFAEPEDDPNTPDPDQDPTGAKLAALERKLAEIDQRETARTQAEASSREQERLDAIEANCQKQLAKIEGLDDATRDWIYTRSLTTHHTPEGLPDIEAAHKEFLEFETARQKAWATTKKAPYIPGSGTSATQVPDLDDEAQRHAWMKERLRANEAD